VTIVVDCLNDLSDRRPVAAAPLPWMAFAIGAAFMRRGFLDDAVTTIEGLPAGWIDGQLRMCDTLEWRPASTRARADHDVRRQDAKIAGDVAVNARRAQGAR